jgi:O-antigen ligase
MVKKNYQSLIKSNTPKYISFFALATSLIITPNFNKESITIPKLVLLSALGSYLLPCLFNCIKYLYNSRAGRILVYLQLLTIMQLIIVLIVSTAPLEQQFFGRSGRSMGLITHISLTIVLISAARYYHLSNIKILIRSFSLSTIVVAAYSIMQSFKVDFVNWDSRTNQVIGTLGNPNFVSALIAASAVSIIVNFTKRNILMVATIILLTIFAIHRTESIQGFIVLFISFAGFSISLVHFYYKKFLVPAFLLLLFFSIILISSSLGHGPFARYLYKVSIQSRGDFWRSGFSMANDNPLFGVGIDAFGDRYLEYRDQIAANHTFAEFSDSAHNYFLDYAAQGGYLLAALYFFTIFLVFFSFINVQRKADFFSKELVAIFCSWLALQSSFLISPMSIPLMLWSIILAGAIIGISISFNFKESIETIKVYDKLDSNLKPFKTISVFLMMILVFPLFNTDRLYLKSLKESNGDLGIKVVEMFPRSVNRYFTVGKLLWESGENQFSLQVARSSVKFNDNSINSWGLILINPLASYEERVQAKKRILELDPYNKEVPDYVISASN